MDSIERDKPTFKWISVGWLDLGQSVTNLERGKPAFPTCKLMLLEWPNLTFSTM